PQPFLARHCLGAALRLDLQQLKRIHDRAEVAINARQAEWVRRCFSDRDAEDLAKRYVGTQRSGPVHFLSSQGAWLLADRANTILDKDEFVSELIIRSYVKEKLLEDLFRNRICKLDRPVVLKLRRAGRDLDIEEWKSVYPPILEFSTKAHCAAATQE